MKLHQLPFAKPVVQVENEGAVLPCTATSVSPPSLSPSPIPSEDMDSMQDINLGMDNFGPPLVRVC
jgi:hypothetical protein